MLKKYLHRSVCVILTDNSKYDWVVDLRFRHREKVVNVFPSENTLKPTELHARSSSTSKCAILWSGLRRLVLLLGSSLESLQRTPIRIYCTLSTRVYTIRGIFVLHAGCTRRHTTTSQFVAQPLKRDQSMDAGAIVFYWIQNAVICSLYQQDVINVSQGPVFRQVGTDWHINMWLSWQQSRWETIFAYMECRCMVP